MENQTEFVDAAAFSNDYLQDYISELESSQKALHRKILRKMVRTIEWVKLYDYIFRHNIADRFRSSISRLNTMNESLRLLTTTYEQNTKFLEYLHQEREKRIVSSDTN